MNPPQPLCYSFHMRLTDLCLPLGAAHDISLLDKLGCRLYEWQFYSFGSSRGGWHTVSHSTLVSILRIFRLIWPNDGGSVGTLDTCLITVCCLMVGTVFFLRFEPLHGLWVFLDFPSHCLSLKYIATTWTNYFSCKHSFIFCCLYPMKPMMTIIVVSR